MSQLKLTLSRDPRIPTPRKTSSSTPAREPSSAEEMNLVGGAKSSPQLVSQDSASKSTGLTQTHLVTAKPKVQPVQPSVPRFKPSTVTQGVMTGSVLPAGPMVAKGMVRQPLSHSKIASPSSKPSLFGHTNPAQSKSPPSQSSHGHARPQLSAPLSSPQAKLVPSLSLSHAKLPTSPASHISSTSKSSLLPSGHAKRPPPLIKVTSQNKPTAQVHTTAAGVRTITVKLPPALLSAGSLPMGSSFITSASSSTHGDVITVKLPTSIANSFMKTSSSIPHLKSTSSIPLVKTSSSIPHVKPSSSTPHIKPSSSIPQVKPSSSIPQVKTSSSIPQVKTGSSILHVKSTTPLVKTSAALTKMNHPPPISTSATNGDNSLSPPKPKKPKVMKTAQLPLSRVRTIMKTNVQSAQPSLQLSQEAVLVITKATELFISELTRGAQTATTTHAAVGYNPLASSVQATDKFHFLRDIVPKKVSARDYLQEQSK